MRTQQEIFDTVARHSFKQKEKSMNRAGSACVYRGVGGNRCWVGVLIPDEVYSPAIEGAAVSGLDGDNPTVEGAWALIQVLMECDLGPETWSLLEALQWVHDYHMTDKWPASLRAVAKHHGLSPAAVEDPAHAPTP